MYCREDLPYTLDFINFCTLHPGTISAGSNVNIRGFLIQAWDPSTIRIGTFTPGTGQRNLLCNPVSSDIADDVSVKH